MGSDRVAFAPAACTGAPAQSVRLLARALTPVSGLLLAGCQAAMQPVAGASETVLRPALLASTQRLLRASPYEMCSVKLLEREFGVPLVSSTPYEKPGLLLESAESRRTQAGYGHITSVFAKRAVRGSSIECIVGIELRSPILCDLQAPDLRRMLGTQGRLDNQLHEPGIANLAYQIEDQPDLAQAVTFRRLTNGSCANNMSIRSTTK